MKHVEKIVPLKCLSIFWITLEMPLIKCEVNLILTWSSTCIITNFAGVEKLAITDRKNYVVILALSTQDNANCFRN